MSPHTAPPTEPLRHRRSPRSRRTAALLAAVAAAAGLAIVAQTASAGSLPSGTQLYSDPASRVVTWVEANPNDSRTSVISSRIASQPQGIWFSQYKPDTVTTETRALTSAASAAGEVPVLVAYMIPNRDCGGASAGGAPDLASYDAWVQKFAAGLGGERVLVILEPDSLALITCLSSSELSARNASLSRAGAAIHAANPNAKVYYDAGHSAWNSASVMASRLKAAGITAHGDGIYSNASNYQHTSNEVSFTKQVLSSIGGSDLHAVIDTSRNGNGPAAGGEWCDPSGRSIGTYPTTDTGDPAIDAFLWIKPPGEVDGCAGQAGQFQPAIAYELARNAPAPPAGDPSPTGTPTATPTVSPTPTASPTPSAPAGSCSVAYRVSNSWNGGFTAEVVVTNTGSAALGWSLRWNFPDDQRITNAWNGTATQSGGSVTATGVDWNRTLAPGASATVGFQATVGSANGEPASFAINGSACTTV